MKIHCSDASAEVPSCDCLVIPVFEGAVTGSPATSLLRPEDRETLALLAAQGRIKSKENFFLHTPAAAYGSVLLLGLGGRDKLTSNKLREAAGRAAGTLAGAERKELLLDLGDSGLDAGLIIEGLMLAQYRYDVFKTPSEENPPVVVKSIHVRVAAGSDTAAIQAGAARAVTLAEAVNWARDLGNAPANDLTPSVLADRAAAMGREYGAGVTILDEKQMAALGMHSLLAVSKGSHEEARLICLKHTHPEATRTVAIVGKGITFDSGGISIKPSATMQEMKFDMCGAAAVLGAMRDILQARPVLNVVCVVPASENLPSSTAVKPGDIVKSMSGRTIEIHNTDAEGRLVLCDAMTWTIREHKPDVIVDVATLTGAVVTALGHHCAAVLTEDDELAADLIRTGEETNDRLWRLPLWQEHLDLVKGKDADLVNIGPGYAGTLVGGAFLRPFAEEVKWAHIDIAGTGWHYKTSGLFADNIASGFGVRLLSKWVADQAS